MISLLHLYFQYLQQNHCTSHNFHYNLSPLHLQYIQLNQNISYYFHHNTTYFTIVDLCYLCNIANYTALSERLPQRISKLHS